MTIVNKNKWRLRFKVFSMILATGVFLGAVYMDSISREAKNLIAIAPALFVFIGAVFAADYFSKPQGDDEC